MLAPASRSSAVPPADATRFSGATCVPSRSLSLLVVGSIEESNIVLDPFFALEDGASGVFAAGDIAACGFLTTPFLKDAPPCHPNHVSVGACGPLRQSTMMATDTRPTERPPTAWMPYLRKTRGCQG
jgi:hypothetical protein